MHRVLIIRAHPREGSFANALTDRYVAGITDSGREVREIVLSQLGLQRFVTREYTKGMALPKGVRTAQELISWADHLVFSYPLWWAAPPALLKVFLEQVFAPGFAFSYREPKGFVPQWDRLLTGKSARLITTMDSPPWHYRYFIGDPAFKMMKDVLNFCGVKPVRAVYFGSVRMSSEKARKNWLEKAYRVGSSE
ncbi:MAG: NAD(P)H-dependent oxidoreductase [Candidatus Woesearchaeota archaeon]